MKTLFTKLAIIEKKSYVWVLLGIICAFILLRLPSLIEPEWYGDEGIYRTIGLALSRGEVLYRDIWDNKPPLLYWMCALPIS